MLRSINKDISRLDLHDSLVNSIIRNTDSIVVNISHGYLSNYSEAGINEPVMFSDAVLSFSGVNKEHYRSSLEHINATLEPIEKPVDFDQDYELITGNHLSDDNQFCLQIFRREFDKFQYYYVEWFIEFDYFTLEFDHHVLLKDWLNGTATL